jgi:uncharacterized LabA/DUF88 family protein
MPLKERVLRMNESGQKKDRVCLFVDGANFFYLQKEYLQWWIDPSRLLEYVKTYGEITDAYYYIGVDPQHDKGTGYINALAAMGFTTLTKDIKKFKESDGREKIRTPNFQGDLVLDMMSNIDNYDLAILVSGDSDYQRVLKTIKNLGKKFIILGTEFFISKDLRRFAGMHFIDFNSIRSKVERKSHNTPHSTKDYSNRSKDIDFFDDEDEELGNH